MNYVVDIHSFKIMTKTEFFNMRKMSAQFMWDYQKNKFGTRGEAEIRSLELLIKHYERIRRPHDKNHPTYKLAKVDIKIARKRIREINPNNYPEWFI